VGLKRALDAAEIRLSAAASYGLGIVIFSELQPPFDPLPVHQRHGFESPVQGNACLGTCMRVDPPQVDNHSQLD